MKHKYLERGRKVMTSKRKKAMKQTARQNLFIMYCDIGHEKEPYSLAPFFACCLLFSPLSFCIILLGSLMLCGGLCWAVGGGSIYIITTWLYIAIYQSEQRDVAKKTYVRVSCFIWKKGAQGNGDTAPNCILSFKIVS